MGEVLGRALNKTISGRIRAADPVHLTGLKPRQGAIFAPFSTSSARNTERWHCDASAQ